MVGHWRFERLNSVSGQLATERQSLHARFQHNADMNFKNGRVIKKGPHRSGETEATGRTVTGRKMMVKSFRIGLSTE